MLVDSVLLSLGHAAKVREVAVAVFIYDFVSLKGRHGILIVAARIHSEENYLPKFSYSLPIIYHSFDWLLEQNGNVAIYRRFR